MFARVAVLVIVASGAREAHAQINCSRMDPKGTYEKAEALRGRPAAAELFQAVIVCTEPKNTYNLRARVRLKDEVAGKDAGAPSDSGKCVARRDVEVFQEASQLEDSDLQRAIALWRQLMKCLRPDDQYSAIAKAKLEEHKALKSSPDTSGIEGHGGIAIVELKPGALTATKPTPTDVDCGGGQTQKDLFLQAYSIEHSERSKAIHLFKKVIACTPEETEYSQKAKRHIEMLRP